MSHMPLQIVNSTLKVLLRRSIAYHEVAFSVTRPPDPSLQRLLSLYIEDAWISRKAGGVILRRNSICTGIVFTGRVCQSDLQKLLELKLCMTWE